MFDLVMFDLDGTLVDTAPEIAAAVNAALAESGLGAIDEADARRWIGYGSRQIILRAYAHVRGQPAPEAGNCQAFNLLSAAFEWHYAAKSGRCSRLFPDVVESLRKLRELKVVTALVTNKESRFTAPVVHAHALWGHFDAVLCGDTLPERKPHPLPVEHCLKRFGARPARALLVGDSEIDVATARNAGVAVWALPYGYNRGKPISEARPDRVIPSIRAVADAVVGAAPQLV